jgi:putative ABC transport system permease protein
MSGVLARRKNFARGLLLSVQLLAAHRLRTALSISGLLIGVAAVIVMVGVGRGAEQRLLDRLGAMGTDLVVVSAAPAPRVAGRPRQVPIHTALRADDATAIIEESALAIASAPAVNRSVVLRWEGVNRTTGLTGTTAEGLRLRNIRAGSGRLFGEEDDRERSRVAVIGPAVARSLFAGINPVGREVRVGNLRFEVIGVAQARGIDPLGTDLDDFVTIPFGTAMRRLLNIPYVHAIYVQAQSSAQLDGLERDVRGILRARHPARSGIPEPFVIQNQATLLRAERAATAALNQLIPTVSGIALLLGGVGILTVMLISVRERTREIGLRRALGASQKDIQMQFILESAILGGAGGATGVIVGVAASGTASLIGDWNLVISWSAALLGFACSMLLGLVIGVIPATRAARLEPIAALRAE